MPRLQWVTGRGARNLGSALTGLQTLGDSAEVRGMLAALTPKVEACREQFESQAVVGSLYCLQGKGQSPEVRGLCRALTPKVRPALATHSI